MGSVDADELFGDGDALPGYDSKNDQLCAQVADAVGLALATASNAVLRDLTVKTVTPRRGSACLEIVVVAGAGDDRRFVEGQVKSALGWLRSEVAAAIQRRRVPELVMVVVMEEPDPETETDPDPEPEPETETEERA